MAIKKCNSCNEYYGVSKEKCPKCGVKNYGFVKDTTSNKMKVVCFSVVVLVAVIFIFFLPSNESSNDSKISFDNYSAKVYAEMAVEKRLKSPSSAKFSGWEKTEIIKNQYNGLNGFIVSGYVDSQNGFGATIRSRYSVEIYLDEKTGGIKSRNLNVN